MVGGVSADQSLATIHEAGWPLPLSAWVGLSVKERSFLESELSGVRRFDYYRRRLEVLGFAGHGRVLDLGCGAGQWSCALASLNGKVVGVDPNGGRLAVAEQLARGLLIGNCAFAAAKAEALPFAEGEFDAVFCYGVFMFTDMPRCLAEIRRVLRLGGRVYLNANSWGWYAHLLLDRGIGQGDWQLARAALAMTRRAFGRATSQKLVRRSWLEAILTRAGLSVIALGHEGGLALQPGTGPLPPPGYPPRFYGMTAILEVVAEKAGTVASRSGDQRNERS